MRYCILWKIMVYICAYQMYIIKRKSVKPNALLCAVCVCVTDFHHASTRSNIYI